MDEGTSWNSRGITCSARIRATVSSLLDVVPAFTAGARTLSKTFLCLAEALIFPNVEAMFTSADHVLISAHVVENAVCLSRVTREMLSRPRRN